MSDTASDSILLRADPEHGGIRFVTVLTIAFGLLAGFLLIRALLGIFAQGSLLIEFTTALSCIGAVPLALLFGWLVERYLKKTWLSGQEFELSGSELHFRGISPEDGSPVTYNLEFKQRVNLTRWYFHLTGYPKAGRERLVSDKWICMACQMQQDDERVIAYSYMPPEDAARWIDNEKLREPFHELSLSWLYKESGRRLRSPGTRPKIDSELLAGPDGRYWIAERRRWAEGLELAPGDFELLMAHIEAHQPVQES